MYVTTNSALVWKRVADENQQSARLLARVSIGLLVLTVIATAFGYTEYKRNSELCSAIRSDAATSGGQEPGDRGSLAVGTYCG
jgi:hypothetical protein